jgi:chitin disaccharide deacetylase
MRARRVIFTADDFGLSPEVNEAVERGHVEGILSCASLMVAGPAAADALERARRLPSLRVGLHVVLVNGRPVSPAEKVSALVDASGEFPSDLFAAGIRYFFSREARRQLRTEIRAQFDAFRATGLQLDHVNAQNHFHVHPTVFRMLLEIGRDYGLRAVRIPREPFALSWRAERDMMAGRFANDVFLAPWLTLMRLRAQRAGLVSNDFVFGMNDSGRMTPERMRRIVRALPAGVSEVYLHPAVREWPEGVAAMPGYAFGEEFAALIDPALAKALQTEQITTTTFGALADERAA